MDFFNRKKLAVAEAEIVRLKETCAKYQTDIIEAKSTEKRGTKYAAVSENK